jgi:outer membrane protein assembly factor BamA
MKTFIRMAAVWLLMLCAGAADAQNIFNRYFNKLLNDTSDISNPQFLVYPTLAYAPETSWEIGLSSLYVFYTGRDTSNRLSEINGFTFFTLENQYGLWFDHAIYSNQNKWFFLGRLRFQSFPLKYYGIGMGTPSQYQALVDANQIMIKERVLREIRPNLYTGLEFDFQRLGDVSFIPSSGNENLTLPIGAAGSTNFGIGVGIVYDNRHNVLNVRKGFFSEWAAIQYMPQFSTHSFTTFIADTRYFRPVGKNNVLAAQFLGQLTAGEPPFNQLSLLGGDNMMRGYYYGRFRDRHQLATQVEFRMLPLPLGFTERIGAAFFAGASTVFPDFSQASIHKVVWSAGGGLRFLLFPKKDIYTRLDMAFTQEGSGFYIFIGEAF